MASDGKKGITVKVDSALHAEITQYLQDHGMTMTEFVTLALQDELHPKIDEKEGKNMEKMRTLAFQVPESLFQRIKDYLHRNNMTQKKEIKRRFQLWIRPSTLELADTQYKKDNCDSRSEFIEKAILFYAGYLSAEDNKTYLPNIVTSTLKSIVAESDHRQNRMIFKLAVELAVMMNVVAANNNIDPVLLERLRGECVKEVKRLNGAFSFDDAVSWQNGWEEND